MLLFAVQTLGKATIITTLIVCYKASTKLPLEVSLHPADIIIFIEQPYLISLPTYVRTYPILCRMSYMSKIINRNIEYNKAIESIEYIRILDVIMLDSTKT